MSLWRSEPQSADRSTEHSALLSSSSSPVRDQKRHLRASGVCTSAEYRWLLPADTCVSRQLRWHRPHRCHCPQGQAGGAASRRLLRADGHGQGGAHRTRDTNDFPFKSPCAHRTRTWFRHLHCCQTQRSLCSGAAASSTCTWHWSSTLDRMHCMTKTVITKKEGGGSRKGHSPNVQTRSFFWPLQ